MSLLLALGTMLIGIGLGERLLNLLKPPIASDGERILLAGGLGLGALSYGFLTLGLIGLLRPWAIGAVIALAIVWAWPSLKHQLARWQDNRAKGSTIALRARMNLQLRFFERLGITLTGVMVLVVLIRGLGPVTDYDGLAYHLVMPRNYLQAGHIPSYPGIAHFNFPLTVDLLYIPPVLLGLENAAQSIHLGFGILMGLGVYTLADRLFASRRGPWLTILVFSTTPLMGTVGGYAHTDLGWALFEFLAAYAVLCWLEEQQQIWLIVAGIFAGLGLGSKYLGLAVWGVLGLTILVQSSIANLSKNNLLALETWKPAITNGLLFGIVALAVAAPWYLKNWLTLGNPFYPLWFGGKGWDAYQTTNLKFMGGSYGPREGILGLLLLPWDLFFHPIGHFGPIPFAFPPPLSLLLPFYLLVRRQRSINWILFIALIRFGTWTTAARNARYLLDIHPLLSVAVAYLLMELGRQRPIRLALEGLIFILLVANLTWQGALLMKKDPIPVILGIENRQEYLAEHNDPPYDTIQFINQLPPSSKIFFIGNGQSYYVTANHLTDISHGNWGHLIQLWGENPRRIHQALTSQGFTHIYYSGYDFAWRLNFDTERKLAHELDIFGRFADHCAHLIYDKGEAGQVYKLLAQCEGD